MAKSAVVVSWGALIPGREAAGKRVLGEALAYLEGLQRAQRIDSFEAVALDPHGGDLHGFVLVKGERDAIEAMRADEVFQRIAVRVQLVHERVRIVGAYSGAELGQLFEIWDREEEQVLR